MNIATKILIDEMENRGINVSSYLDKVFEAKIDQHVEYLYAQYFSKNSAVARQICSKKELTKAFLEKADIAVAKGGLFSPSQLAEGLEFAQKNYPVVIKPTPGGHGDGVFADVKNDDEFAFFWQETKKITNPKNIIVEQKFVGLEYRILATNEKVLAVTHRIPANVTGDGVHSIKKLIQIKNNDPRRSDDTGDPVVKIKIDASVIRKIESEKVTLDSVLEEGRQLFLRDNSNISTGGESIDCTDKIHSSVAKIAVEAINAIPGLLYAGIDFMTTDITREHTGNDYIIIEINSSPGIDMHHFPYEGKPRNVASDLIDLVFSETKKEIKK